MKISTSQTRHHTTRVIPVLLFGILFVTQIAVALPAPQKEPAENPTDNLDLQEKSQEVEFEYQIEGRLDPFIPFISEKAASVNINEIVPITEELTGMQLFEPGQLNLVAIVMVENNDFAMAEDTTGKGYILQTGMKIGKRGIITSIQANEVIIEETAFTRVGKKLPSTIVMLLKKEGEE